MKEITELIATASDLAHDHEQYVLADKLNTAYGRLSALQAAEPVATLKVREGWGKTPTSTLYDLVDLGIGDYQLFALPCPPAKAQVPDEREAFEVWAEHEELPVMPDGATYYNHQTHNAWVAWQARAMLTTSPAPEHNGGDKAMAVPEGLLGHLRSVILGADAAFNGADSVENQHLLAQSIGALVGLLPDIDAALAAHRKQGG